LDKPTFILVSWLIKIAHVETKEYKQYNIINHPNIFLNTYAALPVLAGNEALVADTVV
jgi:hypothetical protein